MPSHRNDRQATESRCIAQLTASLGDAQGVDATPATNSGLDFLDEALGEKLGDHLAGAAGQM
jgi:hypothetical protein